MVWEAIAFSFIVLLAAGGGFALGHLFTMRSIAHVQPSASSMPAMGSVHLEPDPYELDYGDELPTPDEEQGKEDSMSKLEGMGLDLNAMRATMSGTPMAVAGMPKKADISFVPPAGPPTGREFENVGSEGGEVIEDDAI